MSEQHKMKDAGNASFSPIQGNQEGGRPVGKKWRSIYNDKSPFEFVQGRKCPSCGGEGHNDRQNLQGDTTVKNRSLGQDFVPSSARIKPFGQAIELDIKLDTSASTYDQGKGHHFATTNSPRTIYDDTTALPQHHHNHNTHNNNDLLKSITLSSTIVPPLTQYYVATTRQDGIHLNPITNTYQFTPKLTHIDLLSQSERMARKRIEEEESKNQQPSDQTPQVKKTSPATSLLPQVETKDVALARQKSVAFMRKELDKLEFVPFKYFPDHSVQASQIFQACYATYLDPLSFIGNTDEYLSALISSSSVQTSSIQQPKQIMGLSTRAHMKTQSVEHQVASLLHNAHILPESLLIPILTSLSQVSLVDIYKALALVAIPIRPQLWILRSERAYKGRDLAARNYLISMFASASTVVRSQFAQIAQVPVDTTLQLLSELSVLDRDKGIHAPRWVLKYSDDHCVVSDTMHPVYLQWQESGLHDSLVFLGVIKKPVSSVKPRTAARSTVRSASSVQDISASDPLAPLIIDTVISHGVIQHDLLHTKIRDMYPQLTDDALHLAIDKLCMNIHNGYVLRVKPGSKSSSAFREVVIDQFATSAEGSVKKNDLIAAYLNQTGEGVAIRVYDEVLSELALPRDKNKKYFWKTVQQ